MSDADEVLTAHAEGDSKLTVRLFGPDDEECPEQYLLLEGDSTSLRFLAEFILAHVNADKGCGWGLHPNGAGSSHFSGDSTVGIYLHKLPCDLQHGSIAERLR